MNPAMVIEAQKVEVKNPFTAFLVPLVCTGLGQAYNADMVKGTALVLIRYLALCLISLSGVKRGANSKAPQTKYRPARHRMVPLKS